MLNDDYTRWSLWWWSFRFILVRSPLGSATQLMLERFTWMERPFAGVFTRCGNENQGGSGDGCGP